MGAGVHEEEEVEVVAPRADDSAGPGAAGVDDRIANMSEAVRLEPAAGTAEPRISYVVARLERAIRVAISARVSPHGLTTLQYTTLSVLDRHGAPLSNAQLARRSYMTPQAMGEVIAALEEKGLIKRNAHPSHGRLLPASLTAKGRRVLDACEDAVDEMENAMLAGLTARERATARKVLTSAVRSLGAGFPRD